MELVRDSRITNWADDAWIGSVMREHRIPMHGMPEIYHGSGYGYNATMKQADKASLHSCRPELMEELWTHRTMSSLEQPKDMAGKI